MSSQRSMITPRLSTSQRPSHLAAIDESEEHSPDRDNPEAPSTGTIFPQADPELVEVPSGKEPTASGNPLVGDKSSLDESIYATSSPGGVGEPGGGRPHVPRWNSMNHGRFHQFPNHWGEKGDPWIVCAHLGGEYDKAQCEAWKAEIKNLLLFASLFSAMVTAFTVEVLKRLQPDQAEITSTVLLSIHHQLNNLIAQNATTISLPEPFPDPSGKGFAAPAFLVNVNICWFLSLTFSLTTVLTGILCLQWIQSYQRIDVSAPGEATVALRYFRLQGLRYWRVPDIIALLPVLLQAALSLFFIGMFLFLWNFNKRVARAVGGAAGITVGFLLFTTFAPGVELAFSLRYLQPERAGIYSQCPYKSAQSWALRPLFLGIWLGILRLKKRILKEMDVSISDSDPDNCDNGEDMILKAKTWSSNDIIFAHSEHAPSASMKGLAWIATSFTHNEAAMWALLQCVADSDSSKAGRVLLDGLEAFSGFAVGCGTTADVLRIPAELWNDIVLGNVIDFVAAKNDRMTRPLLKYRFEIFCRLMSCAARYLPDPAAEGPSHLPLPEADMGIAEAQIESMHAYQIFHCATEDLPVECRIQWFQSFWSYITTARVQRVIYLLERDRRLLPNLLVPLEASSPFHMSAEAVEYATILNQRLIQYLSDDTALPDLQERISKALTYVTVTYIISCGREWPLRDWTMFKHQIDRPQWASSFEALILTIHTAQERFPRKGVLPRPGKLQDNPHKVSKGAYGLVPERYRYWWARVTYDIIYPSLSFDEDLSALRWIAHGNHHAERLNW